MEELDTKLLPPKLNLVHSSLLLSDKGRIAKGPKFMCQSETGDLQLHLGDDCVDAESD